MALSNHRLEAFGLTSMYYVTLNSKNINFVLVLPRLRLGVCRLCTSFKNNLILLTSLFLYINLSYRVIKSYFL